MVAMNTEPADIELIKTTPDGDPGALSSGARRVVVLVLVLAVLLAAAGGGYVLWRRGQSSAPPQAQPQKADKVQVRQDTAQVTLPPLEATDALVRELVGGLSSHPVVASWLATDRLISNFVVVTGRIADGGTPVAELKAIGPITPFRARTSAKGAVIDPSSYRRYDRYAQAVAAIDAKGAARVYQTLKPRVDEADRNFGGAGNFDPQLERAIGELLKVPVVEGDVAVQPSGTGIGYVFAEARLEGLSQAQKQLLRMGPQNVRAIQGKLREIAAALGIPDSRLPAAQ
jgi:hypothetical protein